LLARNEDALKQVKNELDESQNQKHDYIVADFSKPDELKNKVAEILKDCLK
jgi:3-oxoacyl-[acyl-carrier protein] reductase